MPIHGKEFEVEVEGFSGMTDITSLVKRVVAESGLSEGIINVFAIGSTASVTTTEYEPALSDDFKEKLDDLVPRNWESRHSKTWGDDNGFSHIRASLMGPSLTLPLHEGEPLLGTWQQVVVINHDNRDRVRRVFIQIIGKL